MGPEGFDWAPATRVAVGARQWIVGREREVSAVIRTGRYTEVRYRDDPRTWRFGNSTELLLRA